MVKIKQSPKLPAEERKMQLLMSAQKLFTKKGFKETTTNEIAADAKLTKGALYFHFKNKEDILFELIKHVTGHMSKVVVEKSDKLKSPKDYMKLFLECEGIGCEHGELAFNLNFWVQALSIPKIKRHLNRKFSDLTEKFIETVDSKYARTKNEKRQLAILTFSIVDGLIIRQIMDESVVNLNAQYRIFDTILNARAGEIKKGNRKK
jgi:AcrR family transcriptional regulator